MRRLALALLALLVPLPAARAQEAACSLVVDAASGAAIERTGPACAERVTPASTFKVPLALIGFEAGILTGPHAPVWRPGPGEETLLPSWKGPVDPTIWERDSVVWYSQALTRRLGMRRFEAAVDRLGYGNRDLSGDPGRANGLTHAWLSSSLAISPEEQTDFLRRLVADPSEAAAKTRAVLPRFEAAAGWTVYGKTGSGFARKPDGTLDRVRQIGWFVGIAEKDGKRLVFARLVRDEVRTEGYGGPRARDAMLARLKELLGRL